MLCRNTTDARPVRSRDGAFLPSLSGALGTIVLYKVALHAVRGREKTDPWVENVKCWTSEWKSGSLTDVNGNTCEPHCLPWRDHTARRGGRYCPQTWGQLWNQMQVWLILPSIGQEQKVQRHRKWGHFHHLNGFLVSTWTECILIRKIMKTVGSDLFCLWTEK